MASRQSAHDPIVKQAIEWMVLLRSGDADEAEQRAFAAWRSADPLHEAACARLERSLGWFRAAAARRGAAPAVRQALLVSPRRRRIVRGALGFAGLSLGAGLLAHRVIPLHEIAADLRTATGERRTYALADGSRVVLNARSAAEVRFDDRQRLIYLRSGELIATVAQDPVRPFVVQTGDGAVRALGTRFLVRRDEHSTRVVVLHSAVDIETAKGARERLQAGQATNFDGVGTDGPGAALAAETAWEDGVLEVHDRPLAEVVAALRRYRTGVIRLDPQAASQRVTGVFPLDDTDRALRALAQALPLRVRRYTPYVVIVEPRERT